MFIAGINYENDGDYVNAAIAYLLAGEKGCLDSLFRASVIYEYGKGSVKANLESVSVDVKIEMNDVKKYM